MKKKINRQLMAIASVAIFATVLLVSLVFYKLYENQIVTDLKTYARLLVDTSFVEELAEGNDLPDTEHIRLTLIDSDGDVCFDNEADNDSMGNHKDRPEVQQAMEEGEGTAVRHSDTMGRSTFYYAMELEDGMILRVSREAGSIWSIFFSAMPVLILIVLLLLAVCMMVSHLLTRRLVAPIEQLASDMNSEQEITTYEELQPFIDTIRKQHEDITKNALIRQEFTANVSHELKTPLTSISGYAELIETGMASSEDVLRFASGIHKNSNRLLTLINDIIRLSELDGAEQEVVFEPVNLMHAARTCVDMLQFSADKHDVTLVLGGEECYAWAARQMIDELLYNLCDNAIRYNNPGGRVYVEVKDLGNLVELKVEDTGIGIPKEAQERVFERFYRVDKSRSKSTGGTGLGLAIVKHIIAKLDAQITLKSEVGKGTRVTVWFQKEMK